MRPEINQSMRAAVAERYGCGPGEVVRIGCRYCGSVIVIDRRRKGRTQFLDILGRSWPELDHVVPLYWGGPHTADNLEPACLHCNRSKGPRRLSCLP